MHGGAKTYSIGIKFMISRFYVFVTQFAHGCSMTWRLERNHMTVLTGFIIAICFSLISVAFC